MTTDEFLHHAFRRYSTVATVALTKRLGANQLDLVQTSVQDAFLKAASSWPRKGTPEHPERWLIQVAYRSALDQLRQEKRMPLSAYEAEDLENHPDLSYDPADLINYETDSIASDEQLRMMFVTCHAGIPRESQIALILQILCGFGVREIASAFRTSEEAIFQRLSRAKQVIRAQSISLDLPPASRLRESVSSVHEALYALFAAGYGVHSGGEAVNGEFCIEAIRLAVLLADHPAGNQPDTHALLALMHLHASRLQTRLGARGEMLLLDEQDRGHWDRERIFQGLRHLGKAASGSAEASRFHLEAGIAAAHGVAESYASTDWGQIIGYYEQLRSRFPSPVVELNYAIALGLARGATVALPLLRLLLERRELQKDHLLYAALGEFSSRAGDFKAASGFFRQALSLARVEPERRFIEKKLGALSGR